MIKLVAYKVTVNGNEITIQDSEGEICRSADVNVLLSFLNEPYTDNVTFAIKCFWDMDTELAPILRKLGLSALRKLASETHTYEQLFYIPSKVFGIKNGKQQSYFYHLSQYFPDEPEPEDVETTAALAQGVMEAYNAMGFHPKKLTSPIAIYESEILKHMQIPTIMNIPGDNESIIEFAQECTGRLWIQAYQIGHWRTGEVFEYDLRSSFPAIACTLPSLQYARYVHTKHIVQDAHWAFLRGKLTIRKDTNIHPFFYDNGATNIHPTGTWDTTITLHDYKFLYRTGVGYFEIEDGYWIKFTAPVYPMEVALKRLFNQRGRGGLINAIAKKMAAGVYGKTMEQHEDGTVGNYYNPLYAAMINSINNIKVAEFIYKYGLQDDVIHVGVDSVISTKKAELPQKEGGMGTWRLSGCGPVLILSSGRVYHGEKKPHGLTYDKIVELIQQHPRETFYTANIMRHQTLEESIQLGDLAGLGRLKDTNSSFDINLLRGSTDREYPQFPRNGYELLEGQFSSIPVNIC